MISDPLADWAREKDEAVREKRRLAAYAELFGSPLGRLVLADILREGGVGAKSGPPGGPPGLAEYKAGLQDRSIDIMETAGFDQADAVTQTITESEGYFHDASDREF